MFLVDQFINYKEQYYADVLSTLGPNEIEQELKILKQNGKIVSLKAVPNYRFE